MSDTNYDLVVANATYRSPLTERQDADVLLRDLAAYKMKDYAGRDEIRRVYNVTLNRPKVMAAFIQAALGNTSEQIVCESEDKKIDTDTIEDFRRLAFSQADARLKRKGKWALNRYIDEQACIRGGVAVRCLLTGGQVVFVLWDYRYVNFDEGADGLKWAAYGFGMKRKKADIESESWWKMSSKPVIKDEANVVDFWDDKVNQIWLNGEIVFSQKNIWGFVPVVIQGVPLGSMLADTNDIKNHNESVFFLIREAIPYMNQLASILQTMAFKPLKPPIQTKTQLGIGTEAPPYESVMGDGTSSSADMGGGTEVINQADANRANIMAGEVMTRNLNEGGFIPRQLGSPAPSGVALLIEKEGQDLVYRPRLELKDNVKSALGDMLTAQVLQAGNDVEIGTSGHKRTFQVSKLEGEYEVKHVFTVKSLATDAGLASLAAAYGGIMSDYDKRRLVYQFDDPDAMERRLSLEKAKQLVPSIELAEIAKDLIAMGEHDYAEMVADMADVQLEQMLTGGGAAHKPGEPQKPTQLVGLFAGGRGGAQRQVPSIETPPIEEKQ